MRERGEHLVHARVDEEEARVAAGPHGGRGQAAVAVALLEEAQEGGADLPRRRAGGPAAAGAAAPAPRHRQQQPPPQPGGRSHGAPRRMAAPGRPEGAVRGGGGRSAAGQCESVAASSPQGLRRTHELWPRPGLRRGRLPRPGPAAAIAPAGGGGRAPWQCPGCRAWPGASAESGPAVTGSCWRPARR